MNINNRVYHKKCLTCANCRRSLDMAILAIGPDDDIYCKGPCTYDLRLYFGDFGTPPPLVITKFTQPPFLWSDFG